MRYPGRVVVGALSCALASPLLLGCSSRGAESLPGLRASVLEFVEASQADDGGDYAEPDLAEREEVSDGVLALADGDLERARRLLERQDYRIRRARGFALVVPAQVPDERGWGLYAVRRQGRAVAVEVPHPVADLRTEHLGAALAEAVAAQYLLVTGARRDRGNGDADVAHRDHSVFAEVHEALASRGVPAMQLHGFARDSAPDHDVIVSPGAAPLSPLVREVAERLDGAGLRTCRAWQQECADLEGRDNVQGAASDAAGTPFVHLEVSSRVRDDAERTEELLSAVAGAVRATVPGPPSG